MGMCHLFVCRWCKLGSLTSQRGVCERGWTGVFFNHIDTSCWWGWLWLDAWWICAGLLRMATASSSTPVTTPFIELRRWTSATTGSSPMLSWVNEFKSLYDHSMVRVRFSRREKTVNRGYTLTYRTELSRLVYGPMAGWRVIYPEDHNQLMRQNSTNMLVFLCCNYISQLKLYQCIMNKQQ